MDTEEHQLSEFKGKSLCLRLKVHGCKGLPQKLCKDVYVSYRFHTQHERSSKVYSSQSVAPLLAHTASIDVKVSE